MPRPETMINLDPIDRRRPTGLIHRFFLTRFFGGKQIVREQPYGHYMFCGPQGSGKTSSALWYAELLNKKYKRRKKNVQFFSNIGVGTQVNRSGLVDLITSFDEHDKNTIRIVIIVEIHTYFPKGSINTFKTMR